MTQLITGYFTGMIVMALIAWWIHNKYYRAHQAEYRRLMSGIKRAYEAIEVDEQKMSCASDLRKLGPLRIAYRLRNIYFDTRNGEI